MGNPFLGPPAMAKASLSKKRRGLSNSKKKSFPYNALCLPAWYFKKFPPPHPPTPFSVPHKNTLVLTNPLPPLFWGPGVGGAAGGGWGGVRGMGAGVSGARAEV